jgi:hypothetical protein
MARLDAAETELGALHEFAATQRDAAASGTALKSAWRRYANRIERALQQLERIE